MEELWWERREIIKWLHGFRILLPSQKGVGKSFTETVGSMTRRSEVPTVTTAQVDAVGWSMLRTEL